MTVLAREVQRVMLRTLGQILLVVSVGMLPYRFAHAQIATEAPRVVALGIYCNLMLQKIMSRDGRRQPEVQSRLDALLAVEKENMKVTGEYRQQMSDHAEVRTWIRRKLKDETILTRERMHLERRLPELYVEMQRLTAVQLERTREFEILKARINREIAAITGDPRATVAADRNDYYAEKSTR